MTVAPIRRLAAVVALALAVALVPLTASAQDRVVADLDLTVDTIGDPVEASILLSQQTYGSADEAIIATAADGADALASGSLQSGVGEAAATDLDGADITGRPLFFVDGQPEEALFSELERLGTDTVIILGGTGAIDAEAEAAFTAAGITDVQRLEGSTRIGTAVAIAEYVTANSDVTSAYLSRAFGTDTDPNTAFADASALGGWAAETGVPILLTETDTLSTETSAFLEESDLESVTIIGGEAAVSADAATAVADLGLTTDRVAGQTRDQTAVEITEARGFTATEGADRIIITEGFEGDYFIDAFAAASHSAVFDAPILLTNGEDLSPATGDFIAGSETRQADPVVAGVCTTIVPDALCADFAASIGADVVDVSLTDEEPTPTTVGDIAVTPAEAQEIGVATGEDAEGDEVTYTASGLDPAAFYRVTLVVDDNITIADGEATFVDTAESDGAGNGAADAGPSETVALITEVNGEAVETPAKTVPPANEDGTPNDDALAPTPAGTLSVTVDALEDSDGGTVYPVFYEQGGETTFLEVDEDGAPTETYGVGGAFVATAQIGDLVVGPQTESSVQVNYLTGTDAEGDEATYTVTGLDPATPYRITLVLADNITVSDDGTEATFVDADDSTPGDDDNDGEGNGAADAGASEEIALITSVNGEDVTTDGAGVKTFPAAAEDGTPNTDAVLPAADGTITFVVDGVDAPLNPSTGGSIRPVVYVNGGETTFLEVDADGAPTELYGVGGLFTASPLPGS